MSLKRCIAMSSKVWEVLPAEVLAEARLDKAEFANGAEFERYRRAYRMFRMGAPHVPGVACGGMPEPEHDVLALAEDDAEDFGDEDCAEPVYALLQEFRVMYRRLRNGGPEGARNEFAALARRLGVEQVRWLPAAQAASLRGHLQGWAEAQAAEESHAGELHLHVGAGRLGLGLVLPAIVAAGRPFALVQRASPAWAPLQGLAHVALRLNGQELARLFVVRQAGEAEAALAAGETQLLVLSDAQEVLQPLAAMATTFSCSIGGKDLATPLEPLFQAVRATKREGRAPLYCCENDHDAVAKLSAVAGEHLEPVPVLVDRVCTGREISSEGFVEVATEAYAGDLVVPPPARGALPFAGPTVRQPSTQEGAEFLHRRKILTVNGSHTTLAFLSLVAAEPETVGPPQGSHELLSFDVDEATKEGAERGAPGRVAWVWAVARQLMLTDEFTDDVLRYTLGSGAERLSDEAVARALVQGAKDTLRRLSAGGDQTSRILGGGVTNRWQGRLANVAEWLRMQKTWTPLAQSILEMAQVSTAELRQSVDGLVDSSRRFTEAPHKAPARQPASNTAVLIDNTLEASEQLQALQEQGFAVAATADKALNKPCELRPKPAPDAHLQAAGELGRLPCSCVALEASPAGVAAAANAGVGLVVGYVGGSDVAPQKRELHAKMLTRGSRAVSGRGADLVIEDLRDLPAVVQHFEACVAMSAPLRVPEISGLVGKVHGRCGEAAAAGGA